MNQLARKICHAVEQRSDDVNVEMLARVEAVLSAEVGEWTVRAEDYDRLANAARGLRSACRDRLPPGHYAKLDDECREIDSALHRGPGGS